MTEVISVRFKSKGKIYYFDPNGVTASPGQFVIVETAKGQEYAECASGNHEVEDSAVRLPLRPVIRLATEADTFRAEENHRREKEAFEVCREKIAKHGLDMKLVDVEMSFEGGKILFFFTSDGRVDFRELVKDLASVFRTRIELRQIGVRDEARMIGGLGICGKPFCCAQFLDDFQPVSIKMAKTQGLSLNPTKISGTCGRLMCCLKYEQEAYEELVKNVPKVDAFVDTPDGKGSVMDVNLLKGTVRVRLEDASELTIRTYTSDEITVLGGKAKRAEYLALKAEGKLPEPPKQPRRLRPLENTFMTPPASDPPAERKPKRNHPKQDLRPPKQDQRPANKNSPSDRNSQDRNPSDRPLERTGERSRQESRKPRPAAERPSPEPERSADEAAPKNSGGQRNRRPRYRRPPQKDGGKQGE